MADERKLNGSPSINKEYYYYYYNRPTLHILHCLTTPNASSIETNV